ncbi:hypothetical protein R1sor_026626 [Riccia sorocarpa]|uniref:F-box domain-containing protein n=1 Tax=Riccia sorocarpa TaxID=122646 RepID=A0ABD3GBX1_9MARC
MEMTRLRSSLWENLPSDVMDKILAKLPISALMNFSRVCKRWECYIRTAEFARRCHSVQPVLFYHYPGEYNLSSGKIIHPYLAIPSTKSSTWEKHTLDFASEKIYLVAADHGLVCFKTVEKRSILFVYNPVTRQFKKLRVPGKFRALPKRPDPRMLVGLIVDQETGNYKLVVGFVENNLAGDQRDAPGDYLPTKVVVQNDTWYVAFEYHGLCREKKDPKPLRVFAYSPHRNVSRWLPELHWHSPCSEVLALHREPYLLPELHAFTATFRAFV